MNKIKVKLWAAFYADPISIREDDIFNYCDISELNVSENLKNDIMEWDGEYQDTFNAEYPPDSRFSSPDLELAHMQKGAKLAERLQAELGEGYEVEYKP